MFGFLSVGGWSQPAFHDATEDFIFVAFGLVAVVPVLIALGGAATTLVTGGDRFAALPSTALIGSLSAILILFAATASGAARVIEPFELGGTSTIGGVFELAMFAAVLAAVAGIWFWAPKLSGSTLSEGLGRLAVLSFLTGAVLVGVAEVVAGFFEADDLQLVTPADDAVEVLNAVALIGTLLLVAGAATVLAAVARSVLPGAPAADRDPWDGHTLEWATESPPRLGNFSKPPATVNSEAPLLDQRENEGEEA
jgi:heme/copper-type cytochrome/quinol oxidase subunit 1